MRTQPDQPEYESPVETEAAIRRELVESKQWLESQFNKPVRHFCYPWFQGGALSDQIAVECGFQTLYYGLGIAEHKIPAQETPVRIRRISDEYLFCLPGGEGRRSLTAVWSDKSMPRTKQQEEQQAAPLWTKAP